MMTWAQQVGHVFFKDVRTTRWFLLGYATLLVLGIVEVAAEQRNDMVPLGALLLRAVAVVICASVVLADAPFNQRAHWATLPYARSAVLAAKGVMIGALLIAAGVALMIALYAFEVPFGETVRPTGISLMGFLALLLATMLIASVERSFVAVVLVLVASVPVFFLFGSLVTTLFSVLPDMYAVAHSAMYASLAGVAVVVLLLSRARRVRTPLRLGVLYAAIVLVGVQFTTADGFAATESTPTSNVTVSATLARRGGGRVATDETLVMALRLQGISPSQRADWFVTGVGIGSSAEWVDRPTSASRLPLNNPPLPLPAGLTWLGAFPLIDAGEAYPDTMRLLRGPTPIILRASSTNDRIHVLSEFGDTVVATGTRVAVRGTMELREPRVLARLPLATSSSLSGHGQRFTVLAASLQPHPEVRLDVESVRKGGRPDLRDYTFVLVNSRRQEAVRMQVTSSYHSRDSWLLAPSISGRVTGVLIPTYHGVTPAGWQQLGMTVVQFDSAWLQESELVIVEWELVGSIPVDAQASINAIASGPP